MNEIQQLEAKVNLGIEVEAFLESPVGKLIQEKAEALRDGTLERLGEVDPEDSKAIRALQNNLRVVELIKHWLDEALIESVSSLEQLQALERED